MPKQTTVRLPDELADEAETVARVRGTSVNQLIIESLNAEIDRARADHAFIEQAAQLVERDRKILERLAAPRSRINVKRTWTGDEFFAGSRPPTVDDVSIATDGRRLDTPEKLIAYIDEINSARSDLPSA